MKKAFLHLNSGASGDMLLGSCLDILQKRGKGKGFEERLFPWSSKLRGLLALEKGARISLKEVTRCGDGCLKVDFFVGKIHADFYSPNGSYGEAELAHVGHSHGRNLSDILKILESQSKFLPSKALSLAEKIFFIIAAAEAIAHETTLEKVHFHEVGEFDSIMDVVGFALAWEMLAVRETFATPVTTGSGSVMTAHGKLSVPAPAVRAVVEEYQIPYSKIILPGECLTPTGAAILAAVVDNWKEELTGDVESEGERGRGAGNKEFEDIGNFVSLEIL
jgi:uncharacterized protein (DUF111 family)